jgi:hypothetical protein
MRIAGESQSAKRKLGQLSDSSKHALDTWNSKSMGEKAKSAAHAVAQAGKGLVHHTIHHVKHEAEMYKGAAHAVGHMASGKKWGDLDDHHKKHLRNALIHAGLTAGSMALGDASGHGGHAISNLIASFAHEHAHHAITLGAGEIGLKAGKDAVKRALTASDLTGAKKRDLAEKIARVLCGAGIPTSEWVHILAEIEKQLKAKQAR